MKRILPAIFVLILTACVSPARTSEVSSSTAEVTVTLTPSPTFTETPTATASPEPTATPPAAEVTLEQKVWNDLFTKNGYTIDKDKNVVSKDGVVTGLKQDGSFVTMTRVYAPLGSEPLTRLVDKDELKFGDKSAIEMQGGKFDGTQFVPETMVAEDGTVSKVEKVPFGAVMTKMIEQAAIAKKNLMDKYPTKGAEMWADDTGEIRNITNSMGIHDLLGLVLGGRNEKVRIILSGMSFAIDGGWAGDNFIKLVDGDGKNIGEVPVLPYAFQKTISGDQTVVAMRMADGQVVKVAVDADLGHKDIESGAPTSFELTKDELDKIEASLTLPQ